MKQRCLSRSPISPRRRLIRRALALAFLLGGCGSREQQPGSSPPTRAVATLFPTAVLPAPSQPTRVPDAGEPTADIPDTGWLAGEPGVELRRLQVPFEGITQPVPIVVVRLDPAAIGVHVVYDPAQPRPLRAWASVTQTTLVFNGGFFTEDFQTTALLISGGQASGASYEGFGGMLSVDQAGQIALRPLRDNAYDPNEPLVEAIQSFPMLVMPGGEAALFEDNGHRARRTAVALDRSGRLLVIAAPTSVLTLHDLANWLQSGDLEIDRALNLDGGPSTGLFLNSAGLREQVDSFGSLPIVITISHQ